MLLLTYIIYQYIEYSIHVYYFIVAGASQSRASSDDAYMCSAIQWHDIRVLAPECPSWMVAECGYTQRLHDLHEGGFELDGVTWVWAATRGHVDCLAFAVSHGYALHDGILRVAVEEGQQAVVEFLVEQGLPRKPYMQFPPWGGIVPPAQLKCVQWLADKGVVFNPYMLIKAAEFGDVDFVRWLHQRVVPLWRDTRDKPDVNDWDWDVFPVDWDDTQTL
jgi:hypothetical protein